MKDKVKDKVASAFTLLELLTVIAIIGILAAIIGPNLGNFKTNVVAAATQQLLSDIGRARQLAISQHTTVFMVFLPPGYENDLAYKALQTGDPTNYGRGLTLLDRQLMGYNFVSLRNIGDQPGQHTNHYWSAWKTLPEGAFIPMEKFTNAPNVYYSVYAYNANNNTMGVFTNVFGFSTNLSIPFPNEQVTIKYNGRYTSLPYIAFNYLGQLVYSDGVNEQVRSLPEMIPLAKGSVSFPRDPATHKPIIVPNGKVQGMEIPPGNSRSNSFNLICIDPLTGRTRVLRQEVL